MKNTWQIWWQNLRDYQQNLIWLILAIFIGSYYTILMIKSAINPANTGWLINAKDASQHYLSWLFYLQDSQWHFPLSFTSRLLYPTGFPISYTDAFPLLAVPSKFVGNLLFLSEFQFFGLSIVFLHILQLYFGFRIGQVISHNDLIYSFLSGLLILLFPPLTWRLLGHIALANMWVIVCGLWLYLKNYPKYNFKTILLPQILLIFMAGGIHPYLAIMAIAISMATYSKFFLLKKINLNQSIVWGLITLATLLFSWKVFGYLSFESVAEADGYGIHSLNLLSPFNSMGISAFLPAIPRFFDEQTEGFNYLGLGGIILLFSNLIPLGLSWSKLWQSSLLPLTILSILFTLFAISSIVTFGPYKILEIPLPEAIIQVFSIFRATGRFFWPVNLGIIIGLLAINYQFWRKWPAYIIVLLIVAIQYMDLSPLRQDIRYWTNQPLQPSSLTSPIWHELGKNHQKLIVLPAYQCGIDVTPTLRFQDLALIATEQKMKLNSFYVARLSTQLRDIHCEQLPEEVIAGNLELDAAYVFSTKLYQQIESKQEITSHQCEIVDQLILCTKL